MNEKLAPLTGTRKAAILLVLLGDEVASLIYKNLSEEDLRVITQEISDLSQISPEIAENQRQPSVVKSHAECQVTTLR